MDCPKNISKTLSSQSFEVIEPVYTPTSPFTIITIDSSVIGNTPCNTTEFPNESYVTKKMQINICLENLKKNNNQNSKTEIKALMRHLSKLNNAEQQGITFSSFRENIIENYKNDANVSLTLKKLYL